MTTNEVIVKLETICSRSEQCSYDLRQKMLRWGVPPFKHPEIIAHLVEKRYLDDCRYASAVTRTKFAINGWGRMKIKRWLESKHIDAGTIDSVLRSEIEEESYHARLVELMTSKLRSLKSPLTYEIRGKVYRFALQRGFEPAMILDILRKMNRE